MQYKFYLTGRSGTREVFPSNDGTLEYSFNKESNRSNFTRELEGTIILTGEDFEWLYNQELLIYRCDLISIEIQKKCDGIWNPDWFQGDISLNSGEWNLDKCKVELSIKKFDRYQCFDDNADEEVNVLSIWPPRTIFIKEGNLERQSFSDSIGPGQMFDRFPGETDPWSKGWVVLEERYRAYTSPHEDPNGAGTYSITWIRETKYSPTTMLGWIQLSFDFYGRHPIVLNRKDDPYNPSSPYDYGYTYQVLDKPIDNGRLLYDVFKMFIDRICPGLTVESDFFQWNSINPTSINYVTEEESKVRNLVLFQKSDIKRPYGTGNATTAEINFTDLLEDICNIFQLEWEITDDDKFKIEHVSYKNRVLALDTTVGEHARLNLGNRAYTYDNDDIPKKEEFVWMDESYGDFKAAPIVYTNSCAGNGENKETSYAVKNITTDVIYCLNNSASDSKIVSDDGFVLIACNDAFAVVREKSVRGGNTVNNSLAWSQLHRDYWRHNRALLNFKMNYNDTLAITTKPTKLQENVRFRLCCASDFDTDNLIKTALGTNGILKSATFNLYKEILEMSVLFPAEGKLTENDPPVAHNDAAATYVNIPVLIDVLANDTDDGVIVPSTLELIANVFGGTAVVTQDWKVLFTPTIDFSGVGYCYYRVKDNYGIVSNIATVTITVVGGTPLPVANGTSFKIAKNRELARFGGALTVNDTAPTPITVVEESKATDQGGTVIIRMNGGFSYVPAANFIGVDTFEYTIKDNYNNQDTGMITVTVFEPEKVYVEFQRTGDEYPQEIFEDCGQGSTSAGRIQKATYRIKTFSDAGKTVPLDVEGYRLAVSIKELTTIYSPYPGSYEYTSLINIPSGSDYLYTQDREVFLQYFGYGCGDLPMYEYGTYFEVDVTLLPGDGYEI